MKIDKRVQNGVTILELEGKITIGKGDVALRDAVQQALGEGARKLLIELGRVSTMKPPPARGFSANTSVSGKTWAPRCSARYR